jgi:anaerobic ribonucleoside-triphosphate reductase activating protein
MNYSKIIPDDVANGPGWRVSLFVSGCRNHCPGCFNQEAWGFNYGKEFTRETIEEIDEALNKGYIDGLSILGGDPFEPENLGEVSDLVDYVRMFFPSKTIWVWTGYLWEDVKDYEIMKYIDVLVDGRFEQDKKDLRLAWRGSSNQRVIDVKKSKAAGEVVLFA